jgi:hypothetical protein
MTTVAMAMRLLASATSTSGLRRFLSLADLPLAISESVAARTGNLAAEMASNLAPGATELAHDKISDKVLDKTFVDS